MKRCDLHIHTVPSVSDRMFTYDKDVLLDYVAKTKLDVIAITNHNLFDYAQYQEIKDALTQIVVLPGIEVDLENGHILVIANNDDGTLFDFNSKCEEVKNLIKTKDDDISYDTFIRIFGDLSKYLLIPHYEKEPKLHKDTIEKLGRNIIAGEVSSVKKFIYMEKEDTELTPVYFSDFRIEKGVLDINDQAVNSYFEPNQYRVPFRNMVYIGDSDTDIPCMKLVNINGGHSIGVYNSETKDKSKVFRMLDENRIKYFAPADYTEGSKLEQLLQQIIDRTITNEILEDVHFDCIAEKLDETRGQSEEELKKEELIDKLEDSSNFSNTHSIIEQMSEIKEWSEDQKRKLLKIALENTQVTYILKDVDVRDFYRMICKKNNNEEAKRIKEIIYEKE